MLRFRILQRNSSAEPGVTYLIERGAFEANGARNAIEAAARKHGSGEYVAVAERNWNEYPATVEQEPRVTLGAQVQP